MKQIRQRRIVGAGLLLLLGTALGAGAAHQLNRVPSELQGLARIVYSDSVLRVDAATAIIPHVTGVADRDPATNAWRYTYTLRNDPASDNAIRFFAVSPVVGPPLTLASPTHWMGTRGFDADTNAVTWGVVDAQDPPANWDSVSNYPSIYNLQPGDSVRFSFVHTLAPVMVTYYVQGFFFADTSAELEGASDPNVFQSSITGSVVGPGSTVGVGKPPPEGGPAQLRPPAPNPTTGRVSIAFYLPDRATTRVAIYDVAGRRVRTLLDGVFGAGYHSAEWDGRDEQGGRVLAGIYFYRLFVNGNAVGKQRVAVLK